MLPTLYTLKQTAETLRMSTRTLERIKAEGRIGHYKRPGQRGAILFSEQHINDYLKSCTC